MGPDICVFALYVEEYVYWKGTNNRKADILEGVHLFFPFLQFSFGN